MKEILSDDEISKHYELKEQIRYNDRIKIKQEDVAQHSFFVSLLCLKIFAKLKDLTIEQKYNILVKAILHDLPETETSDIPYVVKKNNPELNSIIEVLEKKFYKKQFEEYFDLIYNNKKKENEIVRLADTYSVRQFVLQEIFLGNDTEEMKYILENSYIRTQQILKEIEYAKQQY